MFNRKINWGAIDSLSWNPRVDGDDPNTRQYSSAANGDHRARRLLPVADESSDIRRLEARDSMTLFSVSRVAPLHLQTDPNQLLKGAQLSRSMTLSLKDIHFDGGGRASRGVLPAGIITTGPSLNSDSLILI